MLSEAVIGRSLNSSQSCFNQSGGILALHGSDSLFDTELAKKNDVQFLVETR